MAAPSRLQHFRFHRYNRGSKTPYTTILMSARIVQNTIIDCICINATIQRQDEIEKIWDENRKVIECLRI